MGPWPPRSLSLPSPHSRVSSPGHASSSTCPKQSARGPGTGTHLPLQQLCVCACVCVYACATICVLFWASDHLAHRPPLLLLPTPTIFSQAQTRHTGHTVNHAHSNPETRSGSPCLKHLRVRPEDPPCTQLHPKTYLPKLSHAPLSSGKRSSKLCHAQGKWRTKLVSSIRLYSKARAQSLWSAVVAYLESCRGLRTIC